MRFADCMREHGVAEFPDPNAGDDQEFVDGIESLDTSSAAWKKAIGACKDLQPPGLLGGKASPQQMSQRLKFARCMRDNGVKDFPDPTTGAPLIDTTRIPSAAGRGARSIPGFQAAMETCRGVLAGALAGRVMRKTWVLAAAAVLVAATVTGGVVVMSGAKQATPAAQESPANTVKVEQGELSSMVSLDGTLTYRARSDGSPYSAINQASGIYTKLPDDGDKVGCGDVLYRVDDDPVLLLCGTVPAYRDLDKGDQGNDVRQLNRNLHKLGYDAGAGIDPDDDGFTWKTKKALKKLQHDKGLDATGELDSDRCGLPAEAGADLQGDRRARWIRPAGWTDRAGHIRHARGAGGPRSVAAG